MRFVLLGDPVGQSRSPTIHRAALAAAGLLGRYEARRVDARGVYAACGELRAGALDGANVTMPHKRVAAAAADRLAPEAARGGAVNTLALQDGEVWGHNTDVSGIRAAWDRAGLPSGPVLVLGSGGAAAATLVALQHRQLAISARRPGAGTALAERLGIAAPEIPWGESRAGAVVVNATPLGMAGEDLPAGILESAVGLVDLPYGGEPTPAVLRSRAAGLPTVDGIDVLVAQAARSFEIWTGRPAPVTAMQEAARR